MYPPLCPFEFHPLAPFLDALIIESPLEDELESEELDEELEDELLELGWDWAMNGMDVF